MDQEVRSVDIVYDWVTFPDPKGTLDDVYKRLYNVNDISASVKNRTTPAVQGVYANSLQNRVIYGKINDFCKQLNAHHTDAKLGNNDLTEYTYTERFGFVPEILPNMRDVEGKDFLTYLYFYLDTTEFRNITELKSVVESVTVESYRNNHEDVNDEKEAQSLSYFLNVLPEYFSDNLVHQMSYEPLLYHCFYRTLGNNMDKLHDMLSFTGLVMSDRHARDVNLSLLHPALLNVLYRFKNEDVVPLSLLCSMEGVEIDYDSFISIEDFRGEDDDV